VKLPDGVPFGPIAEARVRPFLERWAEISPAPSESVFADAGTDTRYLNARYSLCDKELNSIICTFTSFLLDFCRYVEKNWELLVSDIEAGTINGSVELPDEIRDIAVSLEAATGRKYDRGLLVAEITAEFMSALSRLGSSDIIEEYRRRSFLVGREITVHKLNSSYPARVLGIGDDTSLRIRLADGSVESLITGEVSVREK
jgi:hypothetical protein